MDPTQQNPLTEATFYIMLSLHTGPQHGYAILKDVQALSDNRVLLSTGTLYGALKRLLDQGWIERLDESQVTPPNEARVDGRGQKVYELTEQGRRILTAEVARLDHLLRKARLRGAEELL
jgi:DNA-binding PadR family transcriptional regulator